MAKFEVVSKYADAGLALPVRKTQNSAGYDLAAAEDIVIPSYLRSKFRIEAGDQLEYFTSFIDDSWFLCVRLDAKTQEERAIAAMEEAAAALEEVKNEEN